MTFMIILGAVAGIYILWLMFRLAALALPVYSGVATALLLREAAYGYAAAIAAGLVVGGAIWLVGRSLFAVVRSPLLRLAIAAMFAVPAACAGYQLSHGLAIIVGVDGAPQLAVSVAGAIATAFAACTSLAAPIAAPPAEAALAPDRQL